ncbi:unnamed protein product [Eruca vesicaria subsp. sativa]|uniref:Uncharacterized protein n=1 Tax=Eruca vesicaria subsp. sativa TaxID=29727 RepID=A0ABC8KDD3_ERUVS|nr:unnamed protein product [Eruca vesicaria subsp. sativa]
MLAYHQIKPEDSTMLIHKTSEYVMKILTTSVVDINSDNEITLTIMDNNPDAAARLDVDLIITDLQGTT